MQEEWWFWRICHSLKIPPGMVDEYFASFDECMKYNAILDMEDDFKVYNLGVEIIDTPKT